MTFPNRLEHLLDGRRRNALVEPDAVPCAVLVPILPAGEDYDIVYTLRSEDLPNHRGQVSFPGGKRSPEDASLLQTALREASEEIGVEPRDVNVLGQLDDVFTMGTDYVITPFVGLLPEGYRFQPNPSEVSDLFSVSLTDLINPAFHTVTTKRFHEHDIDIDIEVITAGRHTIWGATHRITTNLIECVRAALDGPTT